MLSLINIRKPHGLKAGAILIISLLACMLLAGACSDRNSSGLSGGTTFAYGEFAPSDLTCIVLSSDSSSLLLGSYDSHFTLLDLKTGMREDFPLPDFTKGFKTYDIMRLDNDAWLVAKQNCGILYLSYGPDTDNRRVIRHLSRATTPSDCLPAKGTRYSVYSFIKGDSLIAAGSSNGLLYLDRENLGRFETDSTITADYALPLIHLRNNRYQFAQESMFKSGDSLLTVTDSGIYRLAFRDFGDRTAKYTVIDSSMRCWNAALFKDTLAVIWSSRADVSERMLDLYTLSGKKISSTPVPPSVSWVGEYDGRLRCFGEEGSFMCFRSAACADIRFYFIKDGTLCVSDPGRNGSGSEYVRFVSGNYIVSDHQGLFRLDNNGSAKFLGEITGISGLRSISHAGDRVYLATSDGVYSINAAGHLFPHRREASLVEKNLHLNSDRVETVYAAGDTLLIGTRNGLHALMPDGSRRDYAFPALDKAFESPYVKDIMRLPDGSFILKTLNSGTWTLGSFKDSAAKASSVDFPERQLPFTALGRPQTDWESIKKTTLISVIILLALTGIVAIFYFFIKRRHRKDLSEMQEEISHHKDINRMQQKSLHDKELEVTRLKQENENHLIRAERSISVSIEDIEKTLRIIVSNHEVDMFFSPVASKLKASLDIFEKAADRRADRALLKKEYHDLKRFCEESIRRAVSLGSPADKFISKSDVSTGNKPYIHKAITDFKERIAKIDPPADSELRSGLIWLDSAWTILDGIMSDLKSELAKDCAVSGRDTPRFEFDDLASLWNKWVAPVARHTSLNVAQGILTLNEEPTRRGKTLQLTAVSFLGCEEPVVSGATIPGDPRVMVRREDSSNLGTAFKYWAAQLSESFFKYDDADFPENAADILWSIWLKDMSYTPDGRDRGKTNGYRLYDGIRMAHARLYGEEPPAEIMQSFKPRRRGRPAKKS